MSTEKWTQTVNVTALIYSSHILSITAAKDWRSFLHFSMQILSRFNNKVPVKGSLWVFPQIIDMGYRSCFDLKPSGACLETTFKILSEIFQ